MQKNGLVADATSLQRLTELIYERTCSDPDRDFLVSLVSVNRDRGECGTFSAVGISFFRSALASLAHFLHLGFKFGTMQEVLLPSNSKRWISHV